MWGCFPAVRLPPVHPRVFPTHVGVFPCPGIYGCPTASLPHACGGVSVPPAATGEEQLSSPRMWGCFQFVHPSWRLLPVFPTHVGVISQAVQPTNAAPSMLSAISSKNCGTGRPRERRIWKSPFKPSRHRESSSAVMREVRRVGGMASNLARSGVPGGGRGLPSGMGGAAGAPSLAPCPPCRTVAHLPAISTGSVLASRRRQGRSPARLKILPPPPL